MKKIDIHVHYPMRASEHISGEFKEYLMNQGISRAVLLSAGEHTGQFSLKGSNDEVAKIANADPAFFSWMCNIDPEVPGSVYDRLVYWKERGAVGIGELVINRWLDDDLLQQIFAAAEKLALPVTLHMSPRPGFSYGVCDSPGLPLLEAVLHTFPNLIVVGHSQLFWLEISGDCPKEDDAMRNGYGTGLVTPGGAVPRLLEQYPNLYCDLSANSGSRAIMRDEIFGLNFLEKYQDRLMFATDSFDCHKKFPLGDFLDSCLADGRISVRAYNKICWENAQRIYGL